MTNKDKKALECKIKRITPFIKRAFGITEAKITLDANDKLRSSDYRCSVKN